MKRKRLTKTEYNSLAIATAAVLGIRMWKEIFAKFPIPGLENIIMWGDPMRVEYMIDSQVKMSYSHTQGNPLTSDIVRLSRNALATDEELNIYFRDFGEFQRFAKFLHDQMWLKINEFNAARERKKGRGRPSPRRTK